MHTIRPEQGKWYVAFETDSSFRRIATCDSAVKAAEIASWLNGGNSDARSPGVVSGVTWYGGPL